MKSIHMNADGSLRLKMGNCFESSAHGLSAEDKLRSDAGSKFQEKRTECEMIIAQCVQTIHQCEEEKQSLAKKVKQRLGSKPTMAEQVKMRQVVTLMVSSMQQMESARMRYSQLIQQQNRLSRLLDAKSDAKFHTDLARNMGRLHFDPDTADREIKQMDNVFDQADEFAAEVESALGSDQTHLMEIDEAVESAWLMDMDDYPQVPPSSGTELVGFQRNRRSRGRVDDTDPIELENGGQSEVMYQFRDTDDSLVNEFGG